MRIRLRLLCIFIQGFLILNLVYLHAETVQPEPIIVNGDGVEYSTDNKVVTATGNVEVTYKGAKLTCQKLTVNTETKIGNATGNARIEDKKGIITGENILYNFETKGGVILDAKFIAAPYFGKADKIEKVSDSEFITHKSYLSTCDFDHPHYRLGSKQVNFFPGDKMQSKGTAFYLGDTPVLYLPEFNRDLNDKIQKMPVMPGHRKDWGYYLLSGWRYNLSEDLNAVLFLDWRQKLGLAKGFGINYDSEKFGKGDYKFYYNDESPPDVPDGAPRSYQRFIMLYRYQWQIDPRTNLISQFYQNTDEKRKFMDPQADILKDYFYRAFEKDSQPLSYLQFHHNFLHSSVDFLVQKRVNHWFDQLDEIPQVKYSFPALQIGQSKFYFENNSSMVSYNKKAITAPVSPDDVTYSRFDTFNKISLPMKVSIFKFTPYTASRQTVYDTGANGASLPIRTIFYSGADVSTKFFHIFNVKSNFLGLDINNLRHIITPTVGYSYNHTPTIPSSNLRQIDTVDSIIANNSASLGLSNKLQTKRNGASVDLVDCLVTSSYIYKPKGGTGSSLSDINFDLKVLPYPWMRFESTGTYQRSGEHSDPNYNHFTSLNYDFTFDLGKERSFGLGERSQRKGGNVLTTSFSWRLNPKWAFAIYERINLQEYRDSSNGVVSRGSQEQEFTISRDLHCWQLDLTYNLKQNNGAGLYFVFRLKAFPENRFAFHQSYNGPRSGSQSNP